MPARLRVAFDETIREQARRAVRLQEPLRFRGSTRSSSTWASAKASHDRKKVDNAAADLALISGQKPVITKARKSIATFKLRDGQADRLQGDAAQGAHVRIPRPSDQYRAAARARLPRPERRRASTAAATTRSASRSTSCSRRSTTTRSTEIWGMDITVCTTARTDDEARALVDGVRFPVPAVRRQGLRRGNAGD